MHYRHHVFLCVNERESSHPRSCCAARGSVELREYMKKRAKAIGIKDIRVNSSGCLERCELGPSMVIYPQGIWYRYESVRDIEEILQKHIVEGQVVERLVLEDGQEFLEPAAPPHLQLAVRRLDWRKRDVLEVELESAAKEPLPEFAPGAHIDLFAGDSRQMRLSYSLVSDPRELQSYAIAINLRGKSGGGACWLRDNLVPGMVVKTSCPVNQFALDESAARYVLVADDDGIFAAAAMARQLERLDRKFDLHHCGTAQDDRLTALRRPDHDAQLYVSGGEAFVQAVRELARKWPDDAVHAQVTSRTDMAQERGQAFDVVLARRRKVVRVDAGQSIVDALQAHGYAEGPVCSGGLCGACRTTVLHGQVRHRDAVLSTEDRAGGEMMICVSRAASGAGRLILDL